MSIDTAAPAVPEHLRNALVDQFVDRGVIRTSRVEAAMRAMPRHAFIPEASIEQAYADSSVPAKTAPDGNRVSVISAPWMVAVMLEELDVQPGDRVLEIGAATGYNAALLDELAEPGGAVTTIELDADLAQRARDALTATGHARVHVVTGDGALGDPDHAPYDKIVVTAGVWEPAPAWLEQLAPGGRIVVPLRLAGVTRCLTLTARPDGSLVSSRVEMCSFVPMRGDGQVQEYDIDLGGGATLRVDDDRPVDVDALRRAVAGPRAQAWTGIPVGGDEACQELDLWLAVTTGAYARWMFAGDVNQADPVMPWIVRGGSLLIDGDSLAYLTLHPRPAGTPWTEAELGAYGHGPHGQDLADRLAAQITTWNRDHRHHTAQITILPAAPTHTDATGVITKHHTTLEIRWP